MRIIKCLMLVLLFGNQGFALATSSSSEIQTPIQIKNLESRASEGNEKAQMKLANMYLTGHGVIADIDRSLHYYHLAAEGDIAFAQHKLAQLYLDGKYIEPNPAKALIWMKRAANLGLVQSQLDLALLYENGINGEPSYVEAQKWLSIAASLTEINLDTKLTVLKEKASFFERSYGIFLARICILTAYQNC